MEQIRYTPENITELGPNEIFVFGSNLGGHHGAGAARLAVDKFGAIYGQASGLQGKSYAIPTKYRDYRNSLTLATIGHYVDEFIDYVKAHPELTFLVTKIGCGLANYTVEQIAPLFKDAKYTHNIILPEEFVNYINKQHGNATH